jgi:hypothetical protein
MGEGMAILEGEYLLISTDLRASSAYACFIVSITRDIKAPSGKSMGRPAPTGVEATEAADPRRRAAGVEKQP